MKWAPFSRKLRKKSETEAMLSCVGFDRFSVVDERRYRDASLPISMGQSRCRFLETDPDVLLENPARLMGSLKTSITLLSTFTIVVDFSISSDLRFRNFILTAFEEPRTLIYVTVAFSLLLVRILFASPESDDIWFLERYNLCVNSVVPVWCQLSDT